MERRRAALLLLAPLLVPALGLVSDGWAQTKIARVGILTRPLLSGTDRDQNYERFVLALAQQGWSEGKNISFEYRTAVGNPPQYDDSAAELVRLKVDVIYANNGPATRAAHAATRNISIIGLDLTSDPVATGYAESYGRPGGNLTGFFLDAPEFAASGLNA